MTNIEYFAQRFKYRDGKLFWKNGVNYGKEVGGCCDADGYKKIRLRFPNGEFKTLKRSRVIFSLMRGEIPKGFVIDHINHKRDDDRIGNLRVVTPSENARNTGLQRKSLSGRIGVLWCERIKRWQAYIKVDKKTRYLGSFRNKEDAIRARIVQEKILGFHKNHGQTCLEGGAYVSDVDRFLRGLPVID